MLAAEGELGGRENSHGRHGLIEWQEKRRGEEASPQPR